MKLKDLIARNRDSDSSSITRFSTNREDDDTTPKPKKNTKTFLTPLGDRGYLRFNGSTVTAEEY